MENTTAPRRLVPLREVPARLGLKIATVRARIKQGKLNAVRDGRLLFVEEAELDRYISELAAGQGAKRSAYCRVSTTDADQDGSLEVQRQLCHQFDRAQQGPSDEEQAAHFKATFERMQERARNGDSSAQKGLDGLRELAR